MAGGAGASIKANGLNDLLIAGLPASNVTPFDIAAAITAGPAAISNLLSPAGHVTVRGHGATNTIVGTGDDKLVGGKGNSLFFDGGYKGDTINGGSTGLHLAEYNPSDVMTNITQFFDPPKGAVGAVGTALPTAAPAQATTVTDSVTSAGILKVLGTTGNDTITITSDGTNIDITGNGAVMTPVPLAGLTGVSVKGKAGDDIITLAQSLLLPATINGGAGNDSLTGGGGDNLLISGPGNDTLVGGAAMSLLIPGQFQTYANTSPGNDSLVGGSGLAIADFSYRLDPMNLSNDGKPDSGDQSLNEKITIAPSVTGILGGTGPDTIVGTVPAELLSGGRGHNSIQGGGANDTILATKGSNSVAVAAEPVALFLLSNNPDTITGVKNAGQDILSLNPSDVLN
jgi:Ca2+-binding RTX toxin-like protein